MPNIAGFDAGNLALRPSEVGVEARAGTARRVGTFSNQLASAEDLLAAETNRLASQTQNLGRETAGVGGEQQRLGSETAGVGHQQQQLGGEQQRLGSETERLGSETEREGSIRGQALDNIGRRAGSAIEVAGDMAVKALDHQQISHGAQTFAALTEQATNDWNETVKNANPNDPTVAKKFLDGLNASLDKFKTDGFYTENAQQWAEAHTDALRTHFIEKTTADMSTLAGQAVRTNATQTINSLSNAVHADPSSLDFSLAALKSTTEGLIATSPNLSGTQAGQVRSEMFQKGAESLVKSAAVGYIEKTGHVPAWASDPKYSPYINGAELKQFETAARVQAKSFELASKQAQIAQRQLDDQAVHAGVNKIMADNVTIDPQNGRPIINPKIFQDTLDMVKKYPNAPSASTAARTIMDWGESQQNQERKAVTDPVVKQDFTDRMFSTTNQTTEIQLMKAHADGKISDSDFNAMHPLVKALEENPLKGPIWTDTMAAVKDQLVLNIPGFPGKDDVGIQNYAKFAQTFVPQYLAASRAGTLAPNALDVTDPKSMISQAINAAGGSRSASDRFNDYVKVFQGFAPASEPNSGIQLPKPLQGQPRADFSFNATTKQFRNSKTGKIYDENGGEVRP